MHYLVIAYDHRDPEARRRRDENTSAHVARAADLKERGALHVGGPILDDEGRTIGSAQFVCYDDPAGIDDYVKNDPFTLGKVWDEVQVLKIKLRDCQCVTRLRTQMARHANEPDVVDGLALALSFIAGDAAQPTPNAAGGV